MTPLPAMHRPMGCCSICLERAADCVCIWAEALRADPPAAEPLLPLPDPEPPPADGQAALPIDWPDRSDIA